MRNLPRFSRLTRLGLLLLALLPSACRLTDEAPPGKTTLSLDADPALLQRDSVVIILKSSAGADTLFQGKLSSLDTLSHLPAQDYDGKRALILIQGFQGGQLVYQETRDYDGSSQKNLIVDIPLDLTGNKPASSLDIRPDNARLYLGGTPLQITVTPAATWSGKALVWSTGDPAVATVSQDGLLTPVGPGVTYVRAISGDTARDASAVTVVRDVPVLDFGSDTTVIDGASVSFTVKVTQEYGDVAEFAWDLDGDGTYEGTAPGTAGQTIFTTPPRTFSGAGDYKVGVRVRDGEGNVAVASRKVKVGGSAPKIDSLTATPAVVSIKDSVVFSAAVSGGGAALKSYAWDFDGDGKDDQKGDLQGTAATVPGGFRFTDPKSYKASLRITDASGNSVTSGVTVLVKLDKPVADAGPDLAVTAGQDVHLRGKGTDTLGRIVLREWKIGAAAFAPAPDSGTAAFTAPATAQDIFCVFRVTDDDGLTGEDTVKVTVNDAKAPTLSALSPKDTVISVYDSVVFVAQAQASDADLKSYTLDWDGDGKADAQGALSGRSQGIRVAHRYTANGAFDVSLRVQDAGGKTASAQARVTVLLDAPKANAGKDTSVPIGGRVNLHGIASDSLGKVVRMEWQIGASSQFKVVSKGDTSFTAPATAGTLACVFRVTDDDSLVATDTMSLTVTASANADLSALAISAGSLTPAFAAATTDYVVSVANSVTSITVTPTVAAASSTVKVNGVAVASGSASGAIALDVGVTVVTVAVTAQDGTTKKSYSVSVTRGVSTNADLSALALSAGTLAPAFASATKAYTASVPNATSSLMVTPTAAGAGAIVKVNGTAVASGTASAAIALNVGTNAITIDVIAQDTTVKKTYTVTVTRAASANADLSALALSAGTLSPAFAAATIAYTASVPNATASLTVTPTAAGTGSTILVNTVAVVSGTASGAINLAVGPNPITVAVTAADGVTKKSYTVTVTRAGSANANLSGLAVGTGLTLSPAFSSSVTTYTASALSTAPACKFTPTAADAGATLTVDGLAVNSGTASPALAFPYGFSAHTIVVKAQDGTTTKTYTINVYRDGPFDLTTAYAWVNVSQGSRTLACCSDWVYNPAGSIVFTKSAAGKYRVVFTGLATLGNAEGILHVTAMRDTAGYCKVTDWTSSGDVSAGVACYNASGTATDMNFSLVALFPRGGTLGGNAYLQADQASATAAYSPNAARSWNSQTQVNGNQVARTAAGTYSVTMKGFGGGTDYGNMMVTAVGTNNVRCNVGGWSTVGSDFVTTVYCRTPAGTLTDAQFDISMFMPYTGTAYGVASAWLSGSTTDARGTGYSYSNGNAAISSDNPSTGNYSLVFGGVVDQTNRGNRTSIVQVVAYGSDNVTCQVSRGGWVNFSDLMTNVTCYDATGAPVNAYFDVWVIE